MKTTSDGTRRRHLLVTLGAATVAGLPTGVSARQSLYPVRPMRLVVPSVAGGSADLVCRAVSHELENVLGQTIVVDNRPGAAAVSGMLEIKRAPADGYTIGYANVGSLSINRALIRRLPYDPESDFVPIGLMGFVQNVLVVRRDLPVENVRTLIALARSRPAELSMGSAGSGTTSHLSGELFKAMAKVYLVHIPYRGSPQAIQDLIGGRIDLIFDNLVSLGPLIRDGRVRALAVTGATRSPFFPDLPTVNESGLKGYETVAWGGLVAPAGTPPEIVATLNAGLNKVLLQPSVTSRLGTYMCEVQTGPPGLLFELARRESPRWADLVRRAGVTMS